MTFKKKILATFLLVGLFPLLVSSLVSVYLSSNTLIDMADHQLVSLREIKKQAVSSYLDSLSRAITVLSETPTVLSMLPLLEKSYQRIKEGLNKSTKTQSFQRNRQIRRDSDVM